ncbi:MAG: hypothetical protein ABW000_07640 [Actinoplanes sp.]
MKTRGMGFAVAGLLLIAGGCDPGGAFNDSQVVEVVAGAGEIAGGAAPNAFIDGRLVDMVADPSGTLRVLTEGKSEAATLWTIRNGILTHVEVPDLKADYVSQLAAGPDGALYVALWNAEGGVWQIGEDGKLTRKVGLGRAGAVRKVAADGDPLAGANIRFLHGVAVSPGNQLYFAEQRLDKTTFQLVRTAPGGKLKTVFGRDLTGLAERDWRSARAGEGFPDGVQGTFVAIERGLSTPLAVAADGTLYAAPSSGGVVKVKPDGSAYALIGNMSGGGVDGTSVGAPWDPFHDRGSAAEAQVTFRGTGSSRTGYTNTNLSLDTNGDLYVTGIRRDDELDSAFDWSGDVTDSQRTLLELSKRQRQSRDATQVLRIRPDGTFSTAAAHADAAAVHNKWLYLARAFTDDEGGDRVLIVRTSIPD